MSAPTNDRDRDRDPTRACATPLRDCPHELAALRAILAIGGPGSDEPDSRGVCVDSAGDLVLLRARPAKLTVSSFVAGLLSPEARLIRTETELYVRGLAAPAEPLGEDLRARRRRIAADEMRREHELRAARGKRVLPERPPHDPHDRPDAPPEVCR